MDNVTFSQVTDPITEEVKEHALIDNGDGSFTSMLKSTYDEMIAKQAEQSTPIVTADE